MTRVLAFLTLFALCACDQQYGYQQYPYQQSPYNQYPYQQSSGWQRNTPQAYSPYTGGQRQQAPAYTSGQQPQRWSYPDGTVRWGTYDPNTGTMR